MEFEHNGSRYQISEHVSAYSDSHKVRLWYQDANGRWELGHSKEVPDRWSVGDAIVFMRGYIEGAYTYDEYNTLLP